MNTSTGAVSTRAAFAQRRHRAYEQEHPRNATSTDTSRRSAGSSGGRMSAAPTSAKKIGMSMKLAKRGRTGTTSVKNRITTSATTDKRIRFRPPGAERSAALAADRCGSETGCGLAEPLASITAPSPRTHPGADPPSCPRRRDRFVQRRAIVSRARVASRWRRPGSSRKLRDPFGPGAWFVPLYHETIVT